jgi:hypothetical protein
MKILVVDDEADVQPMFLILRHIYYFLKPTLFL